MPFDWLPRWHKPAPPPADLEEAREAQASALDRLEQSIGKVDEVTDRIMADYQAAEDDLKR